MRTEIICGNCRFFDKNSVDGFPVGQIQNGEKTAAKGFCRINKGLILGIRQEDSNCKQPKGIFKSIRLKNPQVSPEMI